jgi:hypothetical protein
MEQGIKPQLFIVGSRDTYVKESVQGGGPRWVERFNHLYEALPSRVLGNSQGTLELPRWLKPTKNYSIWERNNRWILNNALVYGRGRSRSSPCGTGTFPPTAPVERRTW